MADTEDQLTYPPQPPSSKGVPVIIGVLLALAAVAVFGLVFATDIKRIFRPSPAPYVAAFHEAGYRTWMTETFPKYVVAVGGGDAQRRQEAGNALVAAAAFHEAFAWHTQMFVDAIEGYIAWSKDTLIQDRDRASEALGESQQAIEDLEEMLRESGAPFSVDTQITAHKESTKWKLDFLARTSEVISISRWRAGDREVEVMRVRRIDGLALKDLVHGKAKNGRAIVLEEGPRLAVVGRLMPGLGEEPELRDLGKPDISPLNGPDMAAALSATLPEDVKPHVAAIGDLARRRRNALELVDLGLHKRRQRLIAPSAFFVHASYFDRLPRWSGIGALTDELKVFRADTDLDPALKTATERTVEALVAHYTTRVERHEAWHLLVPKPPPVPGLPGGATAELVAYVGELADAGPELPIVWDALLHLVARAKAEKARTSTDVAVMHLAEHVKPPPGLTFEEQLAYVKRRAGELKKEWFHEERRLERIE